MRVRGVDLLGEIDLDSLRVERLEHRAQIRIVGELEIETRIQSRYEVQRFRDFLFHPEIDLQRQLLPQLTDPRFPALRHQHEDRKEDRFERYDRRQHPIRIRVEARQWNAWRVPQYPDDEHQRMNDEKRR